LLCDRSYRVLRKNQIEVGLKTASAIIDAQLKLSTQMLLIAMRQPLILGRMEGF
jgi:hypothetical protein